MERNVGAAERGREWNGCPSKKRIERGSSRKRKRKKSALK
jgi:hypothetical protein